MNVLELLRMVFALAIVLGLIFAFAYVMKRYAPEMLGKLQAQRGNKKRLEVVETLVLDPVRRLVLVRLDDEERLILLGEGRELAEPPVERKAKAIVAQSLAAAEAAMPAPRPSPVQPAPPVVAPVAVKAKPAAVPASDTARPELARPRMYHSAQRAPQEASDDLF